MIITKINDKQFASLSQLFTARAMAKQAKALEDSAKVEIKAFAGECEQAFQFKGQLIATQSTCTRKGIDTAKLKTEYTSVYDACITETGFVKITEA